GLGGGCASTSSEAQQGVLPADIIVLVDNSGSMTEEAILVQNSMNAFASTFIGSGIDAHVVLISNDSNDDEGICVPPPLGNGNCPNDEALPVFRHVVQDVQSSNSLELLLSTYDQWKDQLRPGASKTIAVISDDNSALEAGPFTTQLLALDATFQDFKFDAIVSPYEVFPLVCFNCNPTNCATCDPCCGPDENNMLCVPLPAEAGQVYMDLVNQTQGVLGDLCSQNFQPVFDDFATAVVTDSMVACVYDIPDPGNGDEIDFDKVNVEYRPNPNAPPEVIPYVPSGASGCGTDGGWYYDDPNTPTQIILCQSTCDYVQGSPEGIVSVVFGCATVIK
ncbi:MAG: VWA domain-containing protein, partial [Deltaproteobacteria bacterium]|nr:VWA domain-containing protein [Deltaproteobacteria bacterium]